MRVHHLNCGTMWIRFGVAIVGNGSLLQPSHTILHVILAETDDGLLLIDTGFGTRDFTNPTRLNNLLMRMAGSTRDLNETAFYQVQALGYDPGDVRHIVVTHMHFDHVGGLPDFPDATVHIFRTEYDHLINPQDVYERYIYRREHWDHNPRWKVHDLVDETWFGLPATPAFDLGNTAFHFIPLPGHSAGMSAVALRTPDGWLMHCGDAYAFHGEVDLDNPRLPPDYVILKLMRNSNKVFRSMGRHTPRLRQLLREHGDEIKMMCSHDPVELQKFL